MERLAWRYVRIAAGLLAPIGIPLLAFALHQSGIATIPWMSGGVAVILVAGFCCGLLLRSLHAATYIFLLWAIWAVVAFYTDDGRSDPPVEGEVFITLFLLVVPAALAALLGALVGMVWSVRRTDSRSSP